MRRKTPWLYKFVNLSQKDQGFPIGGGGEEMIAPQKFKSLDLLAYVIKIIPAPHPLKWIWGCHRQGKTIKCMDKSFLLTDRDTSQNLKLLCHKDKKKTLAWHNMQSNYISLRILHITYLIWFKLIYFKIFNSFEIPKKKNLINKLLRGNWVSTENYLTF